MRLAREQIAAHGRNVTGDLAAPERWRTFTFGETAIAVKLG